VGREALWPCGRGDAEDAVVLLLILPKRQRYTGPSKMKILVPLPAKGFDPTETAVSWRILRDTGHALYFATPDGEVAQADPIMLSGEGLDPWGFIPLLKKLRVIGLILRAGKGARRAYRGLAHDKNFCAPLRHADVKASEYGALLLPGGHDKSIREDYLESEVLQKLAADFFAANKPVAAICHGVVLLARSQSKDTGKSVLYGRRTTALTWALEKSAWQFTKYFARFWDPDYFRTYTESPDQPVGYMGVQQEVTRALASPDDFADVPTDSPHYFAKTAGIFRDSSENAKPAFVVRDGNYVSARWPGDVYLFAKTFTKVLAEVKL
jgi:putative intracellular protease/amidase